MASTSGRGSSGRWSELRLVVLRPLGATASWSVAMRHVEGNRRRDVLIARGEIPCAPGSAVSQDWVAALQTALEAACQGRSSS